MCIGLQVKCALLLSDFNATCNFSIDFTKNPQKSNVIKIRLVGAGLFHADGRTDGQT